MMNKLKKKLYFNCFFGTSFKETTQSFNTIKIYTDENTRHTSAERAKYLVY